MEKIKSLFKFGEKGDKNKIRMNRPPYDNENIFEPAYQAITRNDLDALKKLKIKNGKMVFFNYGEQLAIDLAIEQKNIEMVEYLFEKGATPIDVGNNPLQIALKYTNSDIEL